VTKVFLACRNSILRITSNSYFFYATKVWHFYIGGPMTVVEIDSQYPRQHKLTVLGSNLTEGQVVQHFVKANIWFGSFANDGTQFSLVGCTVSPAFEYEDFEMASREKLLSEFPDAAEVIISLTEGLP
jgi:hypothetical protein